ncbi:MAG: succinylglutamate desuccinylase/aspartoacylase family protein [Phycisphaerales bacterium]
MTNSDAARLGADGLCDPARHVVGAYGDDDEGRLVIAVAGLHGNEPAGVEAIRRVLARLTRDRVPMKGRFVGIAGNVAALDERRRFIDLDLNRAWTEDRVERLRNGEAASASCEDREQRELIELLEGLVRSAGREVYFFDLHTTSAPSPPFTLIGDTLRNRAIARRCPVPTVLGLEEQLDGGLLEWINNLGPVAVGFEAGQHDDPKSIDYHEAFLLHMLIGCGLVSAARVSQPAPPIDLLRAATRGLPSFVEVRYRRGVTPDDEFSMNPGYANFTPVRVGEALATDRFGRILARESGVVLLPLYQPEGSDGFFLGRRVRPLWLGISSILRRLGVGELAGALPGVTRKPHDPDSLVVDPLVARWFTYEIFHLLGFRKKRPLGDRLVVSRRRHDIGPASPNSTR